MPGSSGDSYQFGFVEKLNTISDKLDKAGKGLAVAKEVTTKGLELLQNLGKDIDAVFYLGTYGKIDQFSLMELNIPYSKRKNLFFKESKQLSLIYHVPDDKARLGVAGINNFLDDYLKTSPSAYQIEKELLRQEAGFGLFKLDKVTADHKLIPAFAITDKNKGVYSHYNFPKRLTVEKENFNLGNFASTYHIDVKSGDITSAYKHYYLSKGRYELEDSRLEAFRLIVAEKASIISFEKKPRIVESVMSRDEMVLAMKNSKTLELKN